MRIRKFRAGDAATVSKIMQAAFKSFLGDKWDWIDEKHFAPKTIRAASHSKSAFGETIAYVAVEGRRILGYIRGSSSICGLGCLDMVGVEPNTFQKGVGKVLMKALESFWRQKKQRKAHTSVSAHNTRALIYYISNGFVPVGRQKDHFKPGVDEIILDRFL
ncbi:MAG: GNAT family N-acetyltransferase [Kiritimatiellaeota bacterium]|nr:GNAT family N-acetyltransferase [Kiritimatiellota bacterium]